MNICLILWRATQKCKHIHFCLMIYHQHLHTFFIKPYTHLRNKSIYYLHISPDNGKKVLSIEPTQTKKLN